MSEIEGARGWSGSSSPGSAPDAVRALLPAEAALPDAEAVHARTGGNPFYVAELVRLMSAEGRRRHDDGSTLVPVRVRDVVRQRVERLGDDACAVLEVGAVAGRFTIADLVRAAGVPRAVAAAALERGDGGRARGRGASPGHFAFAHAIVRDAVREALPEARRGRAARGGRLRADRPPRRRRRRPRGADRPPRAGRGARRRRPAARLGGGARGRARGGASLGHAEAAAHYAEALEALALGAEAPAAERRATLLALAEATFAAGDIEAARRRYSQAAAAARRDGDADALARAALGFSQVRPYGAVDEESVELLSQALERLPEPARCARGSPACWRSSSPTSRAARR